MQESDSDWDSLSGGGPDIGDVSVSIAANPSRHIKPHAPRPPSAERTNSPAFIKNTPLQNTDQIDTRPAPRVAEQYRNISNRGNIVLIR